MPRLDASASGLFAIAVTPFTADGRVDGDSIDRMVGFYRECGAAGLTVLGIMGEAPKLESDEALDLVRRAIDAAGELPVVVGVSAAGLAALGALARQAMQAGAAGVMIAPPAGLRTDDQIAGYYDDAVEAMGADIPFAVQDFPQASGVVFSPAVIRRIVAAHPSCVMLKHEDWPGLEKISALRGWQAEGAMRRVSILTGNGGLFLDFELARGADGAMTGYSFPDAMADIVRLSGEDRRAEAHDLFDAHLPLMRYELQPGVGLAVRKAILAARGAIASDAQRKPRTLMSAAARTEVALLLDRLADRDPRARGLGQRLRA